MLIIILSLLSHISNKVDNNGLGKLTQYRLNETNVPQMAHTSFYYQSNIKKKVMFGLELFVFLISMAIIVNSIDQSLVNVSLLIETSVV